jgi:CRISPR-associated endonuclease/helicase Cas3
VDVSPYIRDTGSPQVLVFWRAFDGEPAPEEPAPERHELCAFSMGQIRDFLKKKRKQKTRPAWVRDSLSGRWVPLTNAGRVRPGMTLMLDAAFGGYDLDLGAQPMDWSPVRSLRPEVGRSDETHDGDPGSRSRRFVLLSDHTRGVVEHAVALGKAVGLGGTEIATMAEAARWHDVGKAHPAFQLALLDVPDAPVDARSELWAKSSGGAPLRYRIEQDGAKESRRHFRHELASMLAWLEHGAKRSETPELVAYLILSHHGRVRMGIRALPTEPAPPDDRLFARGVHDGDRLPALELNGLRVPETELRLDLIRLGLGPMGPSWTERARRLLARHGPFRLARLEALLRIADWKASADEEEA